MRTSTIRDIIDADVHTVYAVVTDLVDTTWRSDLTKTEVIPNGFIEHTTGGAVIEFHITNRKPDQQYEFQMKTKFYDGVWSGTFRSIQPHQTEIEFTQKIDIHNPIMYLLSYIMLRLNAYQKQYVKDLKAEVSRRLDGNDSTITKTPV